ncbi:hypothetical protein SRHO_G00269830 [Serrasalmus rhombeus]
MLFKELQPVTSGESLPCEGIGWQECEAFPDVSLSSIWDEIQVSACMMGPQNWGRLVTRQDLATRKTQHVDEQMLREGSPRFLIGEEWPKDGEGEVCVLQRLWTRRRECLLTYSVAEPPLFHNNAAGSCLAGRAPAPHTDSGSRPARMDLQIASYGLPAGRQHWRRLPNRV